MVFGGCLQQVGSVDGQVGFWWYVGDWGGKDNFVIVVWCEVKLIGVVDKVENGLQQMIVVGVLVDDVQEKVEFGWSGLCVVLGLMGYGLFFYFLMCRCNFILLLWDSVRWVGRVVGVLLLQVQLICQLVLSNWCGWLQLFVLICVEWFE